MTIYSIILLFVIACNTPKDTNEVDGIKKDITKCLTEKSKTVDNNLNLISKFNKIEEVLLENDVLKAKDKKSYKALFTELKNGNVTVV